MIVRLVTYFFKFVGGIWLALGLIATTALLAIYGSFVETVFESWLCQLLLVGFFCNILVAALLRWPFKKRHTGFLLTHLGLLLIIAALFMKSSWGLQATLPLDRGQREQIAYKPKKLLLQLQTRAGAESYHPIDKEFTVDGVRFIPGRLLPSTKPQLHFWHDGQKATILGVGTIPFFEKIADAAPLKMGSWQIYALTEASEIPPGTLVIGKEGLQARTKEGQLFEQKEHPLYMFDQGWGGYGTAFTAGDTTFYGPLFIDIAETAEGGERALELRVANRSYRLQEGVAPLPVGPFLARLMPEPVKLPFTATLARSWKEGDFYHAAISFNGETREVATGQGASFQGYDFYLSFWDPEHISLEVSYDPFGSSLLFAGISCLSLGIILLIGRRRWCSPVSP